jgi:hypothetical protein
MLRRRQSNRFFQLLGLRLFDSEHRADNEHRRYAANHEGYPLNEALTARLLLWTPKQPNVVALVVQGVDLSGPFGERHWAAVVAALFAVGEELIVPGVFVISMHGVLYCGSGWPQFRSGSRLC